jgi:hypothetical protein
MTTARSLILARLDELRVAVNAGDVTCVAMVAVGESLTVAVVGTLPPLPVAHAAALALLAQIHDVTETCDEADDVDECVTGEGDEGEDEPAPGVVN